MTVHRHASDGLRRRAARGTAVTLLAQVVRSLLQVGALVVMARLLAPEDYGLVAMVTAVIGIADIVRDFGLSVAAMRAPSLSSAQRTNLFWANVVLGLGCTILAVVLTPLIAALYDEPRLIEVVLISAWVFAVSGFTTQFRAGLAREMRFKAMAGIDVSAQALSLLVGIALALGGAGYWALVGQQLASAVITAVVTSRLAGWWPGLPRRDVSIREFLSFGGGVLGTQAVGFLTKNVDSVVIGAALGPGVLGLYDRAYQTMMLPLRNLNAPLTQVAVPVLARVQDDKQRLLASLLTAQMVGCYVTATLYAVTVGLAGPVVDVLLGDRWADAAPLLAVLAVGGMFRATGQVAYWGYLATGASGPLFRQLLVTVSITVALMLGGVLGGALGVAAGHSLGAVIAWWGAIWHFGRVSSLDTRSLITQSARALLVVGVPCGAAAHGATFLEVPSLVQVVCGLAFAAVALGVASLLPPVRRDLAVVVRLGRDAVRRRADTTSSPVSRRGGGAPRS
jgi:O-antigen/teichoic acid export membrane protein